MNLLQGLEPGKEYHVSVERGEEAAEIMFCTDTQDYTLNVRDFGAKGDGVQDDTTYIQAAIMSCPRNSRVLIPEGTYRVTSLFLKDHLTMELAKVQCFRHIQSVRGFRILRGTYQK